MTEQLFPMLIAVSAGFAVGLVYFRALWLSVRRLTRTYGRGEEQGPDWRSFAYGAALRLGGLLALLSLVLWAGVPAIHVLAGGAGFLAARFLETRRSKNATAPLARE